MGQLQKEFSFALSYTEDFPVTYSKKPIGKDDKLDKTRKFTSLSPCVKTSRGRVSKSVSFKVALRTSLNMRSERFAH